MSLSRGISKRFPLHIVVFLAPATLVYTLFMIYPLADSIRLSFYSADESGATFFAGLANYVTIVTDPDWSGAFWNSLQEQLHLFLRPHVGAESHRPAAGGAA